MPTPDERLTQRSGIETRPLEAGALLVDMETGRCYRLNRVGAEIWAMLGRPMGVAEICAGVSKKYGRAVEALESDVRGVLAHLVTERLVEAMREGSTP